MNSAHKGGSVCLLFVCIGLGVSGLGQSSRVYDLSRDFSPVAANPNGVWSYGWKPGIAGAFSLLTVRETYTVENGVPVEVLWFTARNIPMVGYNATTNTAIHDSGQAVFPPGTVWFEAGYEGTDQSYSVIRFTVPAEGGGLYRLESAVRCYLDGDRSGDTDYHVVVNGSELFGQFLPPRTATGYTNTLSLAAGDTVDFMVGRGADGRVYGSGLKIQATLSEVCIPHGATATAIVVGGFVVGATITDRGCGYTDAPLVRIVGGGGSGATATATMRDGVVTAITMTGAGIGYTSIPTIWISSPPFEPWLEIGVSKVRVTLHVVLGQKYVLECSTDMSAWNRVGTAFTADDEVIVQEFDVDVTGRYFGSCKCLLARRASDQIQSSFP